MFPSFDKLTDTEFVQNSRLLSEFGYHDPDAAAACLTRLRDAARKYEDSRKPERRVPPWYKILKRVLAEVPFPEQVLDTVDQFVIKSQHAPDVFRLFEEAPRSLEILARLACGSRFLTQCVLNQPDALRELTTERRTAEVKSRNAFRDEAFEAIRGEPSTKEEKLARLRRYQQRQILRIGMCDAFGLLDLKFVTLQISLLADAMVQVCLQIVCDESGQQVAPFCVLALGKHGGEELNYSSDIDLILISSKADTKAQRTARKLIEAIGSKLSTGFLYRVDMRLRPWGDAGPLVITPESYEAYLNSDARLWEKQSLLKARVIAGDEVTGSLFLERIPDFLFTEEAPGILKNVREMKGAIEERLKRSGQLESEIKLGAGSIRDIEFLTQALQLIHGREEHRLLSTNTLDALIRLAEFGVLRVTEYRQLREGYIFFRTVEHALQLFQNQQTHELPADPKQCEWLARRLDFQETELLFTRFHEHRRAVRLIFDEYFPLNDPTESSAPRITKSHSKQTSSGPTALNTWLQDLLLQKSDELQRQMAETRKTSECLVAGEPVNGSSSRLIVTVIAPDKPGLLSMICGVFFADHLDIREGISVAGNDDAAAGIFVPQDVFLGFFLVENSRQTEYATPSAAMDAAHQIREQLNSLLTICQRDGSHVLRETLVDMLCRRLEGVTKAPVSLAEISVSVTNNPSESTTQLHITGDDTFGFFFEVANALSLCGFRIRQANLGEQDGRISDLLHVTEESGVAVTSKKRIEELTTAVTLIKQFTSWLPSNSDPHRALLRFRDLLHLLLRGAQWESTAAALAQPKVLRAIARVLGMSRYLWEDFLQVQTHQLLPLLREPEKLATPVSAEDLSAELQKRMEAISDKAAARQSLNAFKDYHLFRTDLRHVLGHCTPFGSFSREITDLADVVVSTACRQAWLDLTEIYGVPRLSDGAECRFTLAALGKFGGAEMGFASDLELFLVYEQECRTDHSKRLSAGSFFERLVSHLQDLIESRRKGIFELDLRMRPYGQAGSAAIPLSMFSRYYGQDGDAWPYERQSLVKLRCVAGSSVFSRQVEAVAHDVLYSPESFDFDAMRALREKQVRQLVHGGTINAKLSSGGLVDCEYAVQALQMTFGMRSPRLQTTNTMTALKAAAKDGYISGSEFTAVKSAYQFLRQLIDCLRMVRGNAEDLTVPPDSSADFAHLERRMQAVHESPIRVASLESQMSVVRTFSDHVEQICTAVV